MSLFDFLFHKNENITEPADGYLASPPDSSSIIKPGTFIFFNREVHVLGFNDAGKLSATIFLCHRGTGECSAWHTFEFSRISRGENDETWEVVFGKCGIVLHAINNGGHLQIKIEVDK